MVTPTQAEAQAVANRGWTAQKHATEQQLARYNVLGRPLPGTSQELAITSPADVTFYYGTRGGGKSFTMLMHYAMFLDMGYGKHYLGVVLGYEEDSLTNIIDMSHQLFDELPGAVYYKVEKTWEFRGKEILRFVFASEPLHYDKKIHGRSLAWLGVEESTNWERPEIIMKAASCLRTGFDPTEHSPNKRRPIPALRTRMMLVANPSGEGRLWHKDRYIDVARPGRIVTRNYKMWVSRTKAETVPRTQVALFSSFTENKFYSPQQRAALYEQCEHDPVLAAMWIYGKWDFSAGGALDDLWDGKIHILDDFVVPKPWEVSRSHDWGSYTPSATIWWAMSDGGAVEIGGKEHIFPRGTLIAIEELYTSPRPGYNEGSRATSGEVAQMILNIERAMLDRGTIYTKPEPGPADNSIGSTQDRGQMTVKQTMALQGVHWTASDKSDRARVNGLQAIRQRLLNSKRGEGPGLVCLPPLCQHD